MHEHRIFKIYRLLYPDILEWLQENLKPGEKAAADAKLIAYGSWLSLSSGLEEEGKSIVPSAENLVDLVWGNDTENPQPPYSDSPAIIYPIEYAGQNLTEKLSEVRKALQEVNAAALVVTALDEVAWLYNIRGNDVPYNPVLRSYAIVTETWAKLYANGIQMSNITDQLTDVNISDYEDIWADLKDLSVDTSIGMIFLPGNARAPGCSFEVYNTVMETKRYLATTPTLLKKATKNRIEITQMREAVINDGVALTRFLAYLEDQIISGKQWTELSAQNKLAEYRMEAGARELSFATISGYGEHGAIIHYESTNETDVAIGNSSLYLLDSGGQYFGATTDVTRTMHYGTPTADHIEMYTRVLMGNIDFGSLIFPYGTLKTRMDVLARRAIWSQGLDYRHGTSHGIGAYLNVHEPYLDEFQIGYVLSNEPGYYKDGEYGIRIEDQMTIVDANMKFDKDFYKLEMLTMVPYEPKLIDVNLLSDEQLEVLNTRFANIRATTGVKLQEGNYTSEYNWLLRKTENLTRIVVEQIETTDGAINTYACWLTLVLAGVVLRLH
ncbi:hypothetical protein HAZT_HAZT011356 [Hyalella azteca]|uniref:Peptidase M24 domain-containing protein n=1 Tax=Hyalella azteca TaxID=294128 RepID=A0A6A0GUT3_HYAAZ|nr:hypothetical protein HAZT_HAZT011356 [Hyalella azteca]